MCPPLVGASGPLHMLLSLPVILPHSELSSKLLIILRVQQKCHLLTESLPSSRLTQGWPLPCDSPALDMALT